MDKPWATGLGRYARALVGTLTAMDLPDIQWVVIKHPELADFRMAAEGSDAEEVVIPGDLDLTANLWSGPAVDALNLDLYHALHHFLPLRLACPRVIVTLHDLIWVEHAHLSYYGRWAWARGLGVRVWGTATMRHALKRTDAVVAISEASRQAALQRYGFLDAADVCVVHHGVDGARFPARQGPEPDAPYFFSLGNSRPYKNVKNVIRAFGLVAAERQDVRLMMTGRGDSNAVLSDLVDELGLSERVTFTGMVEDEEIVRLFHGARALVFPSHIEGFGFPVIEALRLGCPVITSTVPVLREIAGDAAHFVSPDGPEDIARGMREILDSAELRADLRARGYARAAHFDWGACADQTLAAYRRLLDKKK